MEINWGEFHAIWISAFIIRAAVNRIFRVKLDVIIGTFIYGMCLVIIRLIGSAIGIGKTAASYRVHIPDVKKTLPPTSVLDFNTAYRLTGMNVVLGHGKNAIVVDLDRAHTLIAGTTGAGKTITINGMLIQLVLRPEFFSSYDIFMVDLKADEGDMLHMWKPVICGYYAIDEMGSTEHAIEAIEDILRIMSERSSHDRKIIVLVDELAMLTEQAPTKALRDRGRRALLRLSSQLRSRGALVVATQRPHYETIPRNISSNFERKVCFRVDDAETAQLVLRSPKKPREDFSSFAKGQFMMQFEGKRVIGQTTLVTEEDIVEAVKRKIDMDVEGDIRLKLFQFIADGLPQYAQIPGINRVTPGFEGLNSKQVEAYFRNFVLAGALEIIPGSGGKSKGNKLAVEYPEAVSLIRKYIDDDLWRENPPPLGG